MRITIDSNAGFCFGVTNAITTARKYLTENNKLYCLGELVHNDEEMKKLKQMGLIIISHEDLDSIHDSVILFRAHGEPESTYKKVELQNNIIIDATCPIVKGLQHKVIDSYKKGEKIFIFGKVSHPEIQGIIGNINNDAIVFNNISELSHLKSGDKITLYSQTTMSQDDYNDIIDNLVSRGIKIRAVNSVCSSVSNRRIALLNFCKAHEVILFVAGKNSSNGKSLFSACKSINSKSHLISSVSEIDKSWFINCKTVGISGATSTPLDLLEDVAKYISTF